MPRVLMVVLLAVFTAGPARAQAIVTTGAEREVLRDAYWRVTYDNDFFAATDRYFTQGVHIEAVSPRFRRWRVARLLALPSGSAQRVGLAFEDDGYTASDLKAPGVLRGDHPYAGTKQLRLFGIATDSARHRRVSSSLNVGIIGQGAGGAAIQTFIHRHTGNTIPRGWGNQIRNDLILNYERIHERSLLRMGAGVLVTGVAGARIGTLNTALSVGPTLVVGAPGAVFGEARPTSRRRLHAYVAPSVSLVGYDATLQGGVFNRSSPYTITASALARVVYRQRVGVVYRWGNRSVEYFRTFATREFDGGRSHQTGGIAVAVLGVP